MSEGVKERNILTIIWNSISSHTRGWIKNVTLLSPIASHAKHKRLQLKSKFNCAHIKRLEERNIPLSLPTSFISHLPITGRALERPLPHNQLKQILLQLYLCDTQSMMSQYASHCDGWERKLKYPLCQWYRINGDCCGETAVSLSQSDWCTVSESSLEQTIEYERHLRCNSTL